MGSANITLIEVHMATGKPHDENKEEEELVAQTLQTRALNLAKRCSASSSNASCRTRSARRAEKLIFPLVKSKPPPKFLTP